LQGGYTTYRWPRNLQATSAIARSYREAGLGAGVDHSLTPRTVVGADVQAFGESVASQPFLRTTAQTRLSFLLNRQWSVKLSTGCASRRGFGAQRQLGTTELTGSGGIVYHGYANSVFVSVSRTLGDGLISGYSSAVSSSFAWIWEKPRGRYSVSTMMEWDRAKGLSMAPVEFVRYGIALGHTVSSTVAVFVQGAGSSGEGIYLPGSGAGAPLYNGPNTFARGAIRLSIVYTPRRGS
jgi:hypothetical protein